MSQSLLELQRCFWQVVRGDPEAARAADQEFVGAERLAVYRRMYVARQVNVLRDAYPKLAARLGARFERVARDYLLAHPSTRPAIEWVGANLAEFLAEREPEHAALARLEWARSEAFLLPDPDAVATRFAIDEARFAAARLRLVSTLRVVHVTQAALDAWDDPVAPLSPASDPVAVAVWRAGYQVRHRALAHDELAALESARGGAPLGRVCEAFCTEPEPVERAFQVLRGWFEQRWIAVLVTTWALLLAACSAAEPEPSGEVTGPLMRPGQDCLRCHSERASVGAPPWTVAGTVFPERGAAADQGVSGVRVLVSDARGRSVELTSNSAGNFYTNAPLEVPLRVAIEHAGGRREMPARAPSGGCNACHSPQPIGGTEGRLYLPEAHPSRASCDGDSALVLPSDDGRYACGPDRCVAEPAPHCRSGCNTDEECADGASCREGRCLCPAGGTCCSFAADCEGGGACRAGTCEAGE
jgi:hypothetical protein